MKNEIYFNEICLDVFSSIVRSACHELKNNLAIINESAGLLDDLATMYGDEAGVPDEQVRESVAIISEKVVSTDRILKNLSFFAHSGNFPISSAALKQPLSLIVALSSRKAAGKNLNVSIDCDETVVIRTYLMVFETFFYKILNTIYERLADGETVKIEAEKVEGSVRIRIGTEANLQLLIPEYSARQELPIVNQLKAGLEFQAGHLLLTLPVDIIDTLEVDLG